MLALPLTGDKQVEVRIFQIETLAEMEVRQGALEKIDTAAKMDLMPDQVLESAFFTGFQQQGHQDIADGVTGCAGKSGRDIRYAVVDDPVFHKDRVLVGGDLRGFEAAASVDADVDDDAAGAHIAYHLVGDYYGSASCLGREGADGNFAGL